MTSPVPEPGPWGDTDAGVLSLIQLMCGWHVAPLKEETLRVEGSGGHSLMLPTLQLVELLEVKNDGKVIPLEQLEKDRDSGRVRWMHGRWSCKLEGVEVTLRHGYAEVPPVLLAIAQRLEVVLRGGGGSVRVGNVSVTPAAVSAATDGLEPHLKVILDLYRLPGWS